MKKKIKNGTEKLRKEACNKCLNVLGNCSKWNKMSNIWIYHIQKYIDCFAIDIWTYTFENIFVTQASGGPQSN